MLRRNQFFGAFLIKKNYYLWINGSGFLFLEKYTLFKQKNKIIFIIFISKLKLIYNK